MRLCVIGTGYVGLVVGAGFADFGNQVTCVDIDEQKIARLRRGEIPIYEPSLDRLVAHNVREERLQFATDVGSSVGDVDVIFIAVGTPPGDDGAADLRQVWAAAAAIGGGLTRFAVVVTKSTVPIGTTEKVRDIIAKTTAVPFAVASNPEFLKEGDAINDFMKPDRVVIGTDNERAREIMRDLYEPFVRTRDRLVFMDIRSAELTKYASNAMLATRISFMNEMALLCERLGADVELVRKGVGADPRIGPKFLYPGVGYGGSCFPKDVRALLATAAEAGLELQIVSAVDRVNERQKDLLAERIERHFGDRLAGLRIAVWGLAFKPETDDVREAPALRLIERLLRRGVAVACHDPAAMAAARPLLPDAVRFTESSYDCCAGAQALVLVTEWHEFRRPDFARIKGLLAEPVLFDGRNIWGADELRRMGFIYYGVGRP